MDVPASTSQFIANLANTLHKDAILSEQQWAKKEIEK